MVTVEEAKTLLLKNADALMPVAIKLEEAVNCILAENIFSPVNLPAFRQSAMDGYAVKSQAVSQRKGEYTSFKVTGEVKAGDKGNLKIPEGEAIRIFTGAVVPPAADCVVVQEKVIVDKSYILVENSLIKRNENIRLPGSQIKRGEPALKKGMKLTPAAIGFIASLGIPEIRIYKKPDIAIIVTGNELEEPGARLSEGQVFESNSFSLAAALSEIDIFPKGIQRVRDNKKVLSLKIKKAISQADVIILSGGISVGKYDLVKECMDENKVKEIFYKVAQKPGKPLYAGKKGEKIIFALPGNPAATLVCYYEYIYPVLRKMMGHKDYFLPVKKLKLRKKTRAVNDRAGFLKGKVIGNTVLSLDGQESYMLKSFAEADAIIYLPAKKQPLPMNKRYLRKGTIVDAHLL